MDLEVVKLEGTVAEFNSYRKYVRQANLAQVQFKDVGLSKEEDRCRWISPEISQGKMSV